MERPEGIEPTACGLGNRRSILLSYGRMRIRKYVWGLRAKQLFVPTVSFKKAFALIG